MKVLTLYTNTGAGHVSAGKAIDKAFTSMGAECVEFDSLDFAGKLTSKGVSKSYTSIVKRSPELFGLIYKAGVKISRPNKKSIVYRLNTLYSQRLYSILKNEKPDIIVCTHVFGAQTITYLKRKHKLSVVSANVATDYTCVPFNEEIDFDYYFIPHKDLKFEFVSKGVDENKLIPFGLPVDPKFAVHQNKKLAKESLGYNSNLPHVLIMGGSMGAGDIFETTVRLSKELDDVQFTVICGKNEKLYHKFSHAHLKSNVKVIKFANNIDKIMDATDILITKPGGLTSTEAMVKRIPLIMINPIPGVESANCNFFKSHNMAVHSKNLEETCRICKLLVSDKQLYNDMIDSQIRNIPTDAAEKIASFLINEVKKRR